MLSGQVAERMKRLQRRGYEPQDARPVYALAAWAQRMTTMLQAGTDANTRAGRSILTGYLTAWHIFQRHHHPRIDISQKP